MRIASKASQLLLLTLGPAVAAPAPPDSVRAEAALDRAGAIFFADSTRGWQAAREALVFSKAGHYPHGEVQAYLMLGNFYTYTDRYSAALTCYARARQRLLALERQHPRTARTAHGLGAVATNEGVVFDRLADRERAIRRYVMAAGYFTQASDTASLINVYTNIGAGFSELKQYTMSLRYLKRSIELLERHPSPGALTVYVNAALVLLEQRRYPEAAGYLRTARQLAERPGNPVGAEKDLYYKAQGIYYRDLHQYKQATAAFKQALFFARQRGDKFSSLDIYNQLGLLYANQRQYVPAEAAFRQQLKLAREIPNGEQEALASQQLAETNWALARYARSARFYQRALALKDSLAGPAVARQIVMLESRYQVRQQEAQLATLRQTRHLQQVALSRKTALLYTVLALLGAAAGAGVLGYVALRRGRHLSRQQTELQKRKIQELEQERLLLATESLLKGQEDERSRLARDLHDGLGGLLSTVKYSLGSLRGAALLPAGSATLLNNSLEQLDHSIGELRRVARDLVPEALLQFGLCPALRDVVYNLNQAGQVQAHFHCAGLENEQRVPQRTELVVYRFVQEALHNVLKHARAQSVIVQLSRHEARVHVTVEDDGRGFDPTHVRSGVGLRSLQARADYLRAQLDVHSVPGQGTTITLEFELPA
ncbi:ATP-binding protein [Hymenobacter lapidiphilus]|uniref:Sensor histidine kinase n=1 Tax=Hymenobacter lapidiphilus TaxID=2608003 RepID=A0A7Y7PSI9_9BACT|nr:sensor histidine kinase [Hymenobacter lapidiphilus]NVO32882.1 sensor histidine kinase [Hymenobacter lapidiphilus]